MEYQEEPSSKSLLTSLLEEIRGIRNDNKSVHEKLDKLTDEQKNVKLLFEKSDSATTSKIIELEEKNRMLVERLEFLETENELLYRGCNFQNLILLGYSEPENEEDNVLTSQIYNLVKTIAGKDVAIDTVQRYKNMPYKKTFPRPIRIRFMCHSDRSTVFNARDKLPQKCYLNEDLPLRVRMDHKALRSKRFELTSQNIKCVINWKDKTIVETDTKREYVVKHGLIYEKAEDIEIDAEINGENVTNETDNGQPPNKMSRTDEGAFLGRSLRSRTVQSIPTTNAGGRGGGGSARGGGPARGAARGGTRGRPTSGTTA